MTAGGVLGDLPTITALFSHGKVSWGQVRAIVGQAKRLRKAERATLDARIAATVTHYDGVDGFDPDQLLWAVDRAVDELRDPRTVKRRERRRAESSFLALQRCLDGWVLTRCPAPVSSNALDAAAERHIATKESERGHDGAGPAAPTTRAKQCADALRRICAKWLGGGPGRPARPLLIAHVDVGDITRTSATTLELSLPGPLSTITLRTLEQLTADADLRTVLFDAARSLAVSAKTAAATVPTRTRVAAAARDQGCRFPGSPDPIRHCDVHHLRERADGGDHHPDNLIALSRRFHTLVHKRGWTLRLNATTDEVTATRGGRRWRSLQRGTQLARPPDKRPLAVRSRPSGVTEIAGIHELRRATPTCRTNRPLGRRRAAQGGDARRPPSDHPPASAGHLPRSTATATPCPATRPRSARARLRR